ncbi:hypothetical protein AB205_0129430, partial [Aquarana catesbeiana]
GVPRHSNLPRTPQIVRCSVNLRTANVRVEHEFDSNSKLIPNVEEEEVYEVGKIVTTTGDVDVVEEETHFTSASAHVLIGEMMVCNRDLQKIKDAEKRLKNIIDVLGRI